MSTKQKKIRGRKSWCGGLESINIYRLVKNHNPWLVGLSPIAGPNYISHTCMRKHCQAFCEQIKCISNCLQWLGSGLSLCMHGTACIALSCWVSVELKCWFSYISPTCSLIKVKTKLILCIMEKKRMPVGCLGAIAENTSQCGIFELSLWSHKSANASCWTGAPRALF